MHNDIPRMFKYRSGMQQRVDVENIVVEGGRRPLGILHFQDELDAARRETRGKLSRES
jgi:hypothetical protein